MKKIVVLDKKIGETPLVAIQSWKARNPEYAKVPASYAGRLDPMASGKLLILLGDECRRQKAYTKLDKEYEIEVLLDIGSDTGDVLGMPVYAGQEIRIDAEMLAAVLRREHGAFMRAYPAFSSKTVGGKPLFLHALLGSLSSIEIPEHIEHIYSIRYMGSKVLSDEKLKEKITELLDRVPRSNEPSKRLGENFRVDAIRSEWQSLFRNARERNFTVLRLRVTSASGTYMRSLTGRIGIAFDTKALALSIRRTRIGTYAPSWRLWLRSY